VEMNDQLWRIRMVSSGKWVVRIMDAWNPRGFASSISTDWKDIEVGFDNADEAYEWAIVHGLNPEYQTSSSDWSGRRWRHRRRRFVFMAWM